MIQKARRLHLKFNKPQGAIVEDDNLTGKFSCRNESKIPHQHGEAAIAGKRNNLAALDARFELQWPAAKRWPSIRG